MQNTLVLLNARAGTLLDSGAGRIRDEVASALSRQGGRADIRLIEPRRIAGEIARAASSDYGTLIVGGGDGSVSCAVNALAGTGKSLGVLPFGTLNLLARDLGVPDDPHEAIAALASASPRKIDLASVNGRAFHSLSGLGFFSQMARAREEVRGHPLGRILGVGLAALRALRRTGAFTLDIAVDGEHRRVQALAVLVTNNSFGADWRRSRLDGGTLELHVAEDAGALGRLKASADLVSGGWRDSEGIRSFCARQVQIGHVRRRAWAATDGELRRERVPLRYEILPRALDVLIPGTGQ